MDRDDKFNDFKSSQLTNLLNKAAKKDKKQNMLEMVGNALEKTQVQFCKVNTIQEQFPDKVKMHPSPLT